MIWALVADSRLFVSTDTGNTWDERTLPTGAGQLLIAFVNGRDGFAARLASPATQCQQQNFETFSTIDGARSWQGVGAAFDTAQCKANLAFVDTQHGYISAYDPNRAPSVMRTSDGGRTWLFSPLPDPPGFTTRAGGFTLRAGPIADFADVLFVDAAGVVDGVTKHFVFRSIDRGVTWTYVSSALQSTAIVFLTPTRWLQIFPQDSRETTDGGKSWHFFAADYQQAAPIEPQIVFGDASTGYATVRGGIQRTLDGGAHWSAIKTPGT